MNMRTCVSMCCLHALVLATHVHVCMFVCVCVYLRVYTHASEPGFVCVSTSGAGRKGQTIRGVAAVACEAGGDGGDHDGLAGGQQGARRRQEQGRVRWVQIPFFLFFFCRERTTVSPRAMDGNHTMRRRACEQRARARERERDREEERVAETA